MTVEVGSGARAAIVTGAASGIGRATAELLLERGWRVALVDRDVGPLADMATQSAENPGVMVRALDVTDEAAVVRLVAEVAETFGGLDGVVNSAGIAADRHVFDTSAELFRRILDINVVGTFLVGREAARRMASGQRLAAARSSISRRSQACAAPRGARPTARRKARSSPSPR